LENPITAKDGDKLARLKTLFTPIKIGPLELPNRIIMPAITTLFDFEENSRWVDFYVERAKGGAGLLIVGGLQTLFPGRESRLGKVHLYRDPDIPRLGELTAAIHREGGIVAVQLATHNYWAKNGKIDSAEYIGPSEVDIPTDGLHPNYCQCELLPKVRSLSIAEIMMIEEAIGDAAARAQKAGFDAIELLVAAGNLLNRFINPCTNRRTDQYGGPLENRTRIVVRAIADIKKKVGQDFPLICRISGSDMLPWGLELDSWKKIASILEAAGSHALSIYPGWHETREPRHQMSVPRGHFVYLAQAIKEAVRIPVAANIRINDPLLAEQIIAEGRADLVAMGTPLIADPYLPKKAQEGRLEDIRMCGACCNCWDRLVKGEAIDCTVNACVGREARYRIARAAKSKSVFVIGGGPGGMEAARIAARRGHQVRLFEKKGKLGGQLLYASLPPYKDEWNNLIRYLSTQLKKLGVDIRLNQECTPETIAKAKPDAVIVATGATPIIPDIPGTNGQNVATALQVLDGSKQVGQNVIVVGGGAIGCETAEHLHRKGRRVTILEMTERIGKDISEWNRWVVMDRLSADVRLETNVKLEEIHENGVKATRAGTHMEFFEADSVVLAVGMKPVDRMADELKGTVASLRVVGDCVRLGKVRDAVAAGFQAALEI
jgi:2,4-dienoyl-CoA reductase-like NADH-dependent reductase (Old Yellow Enzyme family)/thioredoxin reductase